MRQIDFDFIDMKSACDSKINEKQLKSFLLEPFLSMHISSLTTFLGIEVFGRPNLERVMEKLFKIAPSEVANKNHLSFKLINFFVSLKFNHSFET